MPLPDATNDWTVFDNQEAVVLTSATRNGAIARTVTVANALRRALGVLELEPSSGAYQGQDLTWIVPGVQVPFALKPGDQITDANNATWTALRVDWQAWQATWKLTCRNLVVAYDLQDLLIIERPTYSQSAGGVRLKDWAAVYSSLPGRLMPTEASIDDERGLHGLRVTHQCIVGQQVQVTNEDRVNLNGTYYEIRGYHQPQRIDQLPILDVELVP